MSSELLNCDTQKLLDFFLCTNEELYKREKKESESKNANSEVEALISNTKSDDPVNLEISESTEEEKEKKEENQNEENEVAKNENSENENSNTEEKKEENSENVDKENTEQGKIFL